MPRTSKTDAICVCGREPRAVCATCGRFVRVADGKTAVHEIGVCTGSHVEYRSCAGSGKPPQQGAQL